MNYQRWPQAGWLIEKGSVCLDDGIRQETAKAGEWIFPGDRRCQQIFSEEHQFICVRFALMWRTGGVLFPSEGSITFASEKFPELEKSAHDLLNVVQASFGDTRISMGKVKEAALTHFAVMRAFNEWSYQYVNAMLRLGIKPQLVEESDPRVETVLGGLRDFPMTKKLREPDLAKLCGLSVSQLNRVFMKSKGKTPIEMYQDRRYREARKGLRKLDQDIKSMAYQLGFSSPANFSTWFKKKGGISPSEWRARNLSNDLTEK